MQEKILNWFVENKRIFPWRETQNSFHILIAEKLLQQTKATKEVIKAYCGILEKYPTPFALAQAEISELEELIRPLGLIFRANQLIQLGREIVNRYNGQVPEDFKDLLRLPGVGEYGARAVLSFAQNKDYAIIDTNVGRFLFRYFNLNIPFPANPSRKRYLEKLAQEILPGGKSRDFNLAILDFSFYICKSGEPLCYQCPINQFCQYENKTLHQD